jgi:hypothetical protein
MKLFTKFTLFAVILALASPWVISADKNQGKQLRAGRNAQELGDEPFDGFDVSNDEEDEGASNTELFEEFMDSEIEEDDEDDDDFEGDDDDFEGDDDYYYRRALKKTEDSGELQAKTRALGHHRGKYCYWYKKGGYWYYVCTYKKHY